MSDVKAYTMQIRNTPASLMTNNVSVPKAETHSKKEKIKHLSEEIHFQNKYKYITTFITYNIKIYKIFLQFLLLTVTQFL